MRAPLSFILDHLVHLLLSDVYLFSSYGKGPRFKVAYRLYVPNHHFVGAVDKVHKLVARPVQHILDFEIGHLQVPDKLTLSESS